MIKMTSKTISITEEVYNELIKFKDERESFSQFFLRILKQYKQNIQNCFGTWNLSEKEKSEIWNDIMKRPGRRWSKRRTGELE